MNRDDRNVNTFPTSLPSLFRGLYSRVAEKLDIDPSYVSRVARGERNSDTIEEALATEIRRISKLASRNGHLGRLASGNGHLGRLASKNSGRRGKKVASAKKSR
jgi:hypothetical protein